MGHISMLVADQVIFLALAGCIRLQHPRLYVCRGIFCSRCMHGHSFILCMFIPLVCLEESLLSRLTCQIRILSPAFGSSRPSSGYIICSPCSSEQKSPLIPADHSAPSWLEFRYMTAVRGP
ncbi:hypothetical protein BJY04DRAFT_192801 [Aspergillus karnatakaensis]|uniref:uncharacterized protein n=1 Tax=Aspergillus karnatakaensis TaxID=1810916 RepID=UPI003CCD7640